ncbi:hypothetical protein TSACC_3676 [Terrimicrobium sacchariphilum]|uniref:DUF1376 domain-containing protein n=1 Tax=Terrimicrobium sacchariphilum TaxID=690879 RepID=A0A146GDI2_TERSA|nr:hypothetical protein [Terrimicrobium sacchariphilum]GAT35605.1 hypothetical protein TSACC_3676 [Terrimicrobium sacchariphilum]
MAWIESHQQLARHPKTLRLAGRLKINKAQAIGHLHLLWWWTLDYAPDGDLSAYTSYEIGAAAEWSGDADGFLNALQEVGWLDGMNVHDWADYAGKLIEERARDKERKRAARQRDRRETSEGFPQDVRRTSTGQPQDVQGTSNGQAEDVRTPSDRTQPNPTQQNQRESGAQREPSPAPALSGGDPVRDVLRQDKAFCAAWRDWRAHLAELEKPMTRGQETAVLHECGRRGASRAIEVIAFSIAKGAKNLIWDDAPRGKAPKGEKPKEPDPAGWAAWVAEEYPEKAGIAYADAPEPVQSEYRRAQKR